MSKDLTKVIPVPQYERKVQRYKTVTNTEPMVLREELRQIKEAMKELRRRRIEITRRLQGLEQPVKLPTKYVNKLITLYVLELEDGCWYIGCTRNVEKRYRAHSNGKGAQWTRLHKPLTIRETRETGANSDREAALMEDQLTLEYARQYGTEKVRGGGYCQSKPLWPSDLREPDLSWIM